MASTIAAPVCLTFPCRLQCLLAIGIRASIKSPDPDHPYGFSRERYVWALISGVGVFFVGSVQGIMFGVQSIVQPHALDQIHVALGVLGASALIESVPMVAAFKEVKKNAAELGMPM